MSHFRRAIRALLLGAVLAALARAPADAASGLSSTLQQAQRAARDAGQRGVALLVLASHDESALSSRTEAIEAHDPAVRFAMRSYDLVVLAPAGHGLYRLLGPRDACEGVTACAEDAFLQRQFTLPRLRAWNTAAGRVPLLVVFDTRHGRPVGTAYGVDDPAQALRFAAGLRTATPEHPLVAYSDWLLED